jgi:magnesium chelatase subunit H
MRGVGRTRWPTERRALETRTRFLNPNWFEGMLKHGYESVRQIEAHVVDALGSGATGQVDAWVYERIAETFVLNPEMRRRLTELNPAASTKLANRVSEARTRLANGRAMRRL